MNAEPIPLSPSERVRRAQPIEQQERATARQRRVDAARCWWAAQRHNDDPAQAGKPDPVQQSTIDPADAPILSSVLAARSVGWSRRTYERAKAVVRAAEHDPDRYGALATQMDHSGAVEPAYERLRLLRRGETPKRALGRTDATAERHDRVRNLAASGHTPDQIARAVGLAPAYVGTILRREGIAPSGGLHMRRRVDHNAAVEGVVTHAAPPDLVLDAIDWTAVDRARVPAWDARLKAAIDVLHGVRKKLRGERP